MLKATACPSLTVQGALTLRSSLTWDGGGLVRLVLGADSAYSDHLHVGSLIRGADGLFIFDLLDAGITDGAEYDLLSFDTTTGFLASDFSARGYEGTFAFDRGVLEFKAANRVTAPMPEPSSGALLLAGLVVLSLTSRPRLSPHPSLPTTFGA